MKSDEAILTLFFLQEAQALIMTRNPFTYSIDVCDFDVVFKSDVEDNDKFPLFYQHKWE